MKEIIFMSICTLILGIAISQVYNLSYPVIVEKEVVKDKCLTQAKIMGLWLPNLTDLQNYNGRWICVNINETKTLKELSNTINHEIGHEIFAIECERNITKCMEISK